jgi:hypothetical protein
LIGHVVAGEVLGATGFFFSHLNGNRENPPVSAWENNSRHPIIFWVTNAGTGEWKEAIVKNINGKRFQHFASQIPSAMKIKGIVFTKN